MPENGKKEVQIPAEVVTPHVSSSVEQQQEADLELAKVEDILNDKQAKDSLQRELNDLKEMFLKQQELFARVLGQQGFAPVEAEIVVPRKPVIPLDAVITIYIPEGSMPWEKEPIPVGPNGNIRYIPRGQYVQVTQGELEALQHAKYEGVRYPVVNDVPLGRRITTEHMIPSIGVPYSEPRFPLMVQQMPIPTNK